MLVMPQSVDIDTVQVSGPAEQFNVTWRGSDLCCGLVYYTVDLTPDAGYLQNRVSAPVYSVVSLVLCSC